MRVVDAHTHIFPPELVRQREKFAARDAAFGAIYGSVKAPMADLDNLLAYLEENSIDRCCACGYPFRDLGLLRHSNDYILEAAKASPRIMPCTAVSGTARTGVLEAERCFALGALGLGENGLNDGAGGRDRGGTLEAVARFAEEAGLFLMLHVNEQVGHQYPGKATMDLADVVRFAGAHKGMKTILAHLGGGLCFYEFMPEVAEALDHSFYDTAAVPFLYSAPVFDFLARFLGRRILFGSDFPLMPFSRHHGHLGTLSEGDRERFLFRNAEEFFGNG